MLVVDKDNEEFVHLYPTDSQQVLEDKLKDANENNKGYIFACGEYHFKSLINLENLTGKNKISKHIKQAISKDESWSTLMVRKTIGL